MNPSSLLPKLDKLDNYLRTQFAEGSEHIDFIARQAKNHYLNEKAMLLLKFGFIPSHYYYVEGLDKDPGFTPE